MRTVIVGNRKLARHLLQHCLETGWEIVGAIVPEGELATKQANFTPFDEIVAETGCRLHETTDINGRETIEWLERLDPEICLSGGWSQIIDKHVLDVPERGFFGFHSSRLPEGRGGAPVNWSLIDGADEVWISLFQYEPGVDSGDVLAQSSVPVEHRDDVATVFDALANEACQLASKVRDRMETNSVDTTQQSITDATYRPRRQPQDGIIDWNRDADEQYNWIRAQTEPYPGAYTFYQGEKLIVWDCEQVERTPRNSDPGEIVDIVPGAGVDVRCGKGVIRLTRIKPGDRVSRWADRYAEDDDISVGDRLGREQAPDSWLYTGIRGSDAPTQFDSNLRVGEHGKLTLVSFAGNPQDLTVSVTLNDDVVFSDAVTVTDEYRTTVEYEPTTTGTHSIVTRFETDGEQIDTRYLKVFVHE